MRECLWANLTKGHSALSRFLSPGFFLFFRALFFAVPWLTERLKEAIHYGEGSLFCSQMFASVYLKKVTCVRRLRKQSGVRGLAWKPLAELGLIKNKKQTAVVYGAEESVLWNSPIDIRLTIQEKEQHEQGRTEMRSNETYSVDI